MASRDRRRSESDDELFGTGNAINYTYRVHDARVGRFLSIDPLAGKYPYYSPYSFSANSPILIIDHQGGSPEIAIGKDPRLEKSALLENPDFVKLDINRLREIIREQNPRLQAWEVNISAGYALELAYSEFHGGALFKPSRNTSAPLGNDPDSWLNPNKKSVRPDFRHNTTLTDSDGRTEIFYGGGVIEVKASQYMIKLNTNNNQIDAEINLDRYATSNPLGWGLTAGKYDAGSFTLVLPYGGEVGDDVICAAETRGVNLYVQYAFINPETFEVVFSNPEKINVTGVDIEKTDQNATLDLPAHLDVESSTRWAPSGKNPTNNSGNE